MRTTIRSTVALALVATLLAACAGSASPTPAAPGATTGPDASPAAQSPSAAADTCTAQNLQTKTPGKLTIGTDNPAFPPYFLPREGGNTEPWDPEQGDPTSGLGFESAVAYAIAAQLGFAPEDVEWTVVPFANAFAPGPKDFDIDINQVSYKPERAQNVDLSEGYYFGNQAVVAPEDGEFADATTITELKGARLGAQVGTTSFDAIENVIQPTQEPRVYDTNDAAIEALDIGELDGIVVDLPTAFFIIYVQTEGNKIVGQIGPEAGADQEYFSVVLEKDSPLTDCVNQAILALRSTGASDALVDEWLEDSTVPELKP